MNTTDFFRFSAAKLIETQARTKVLNNAMDCLIDRCLNQGSKRKGVLKKRLSRQEADMLGKLLGPLAVAQYIEAELVQFEEQFPDDAHFVREYIALTASSDSDAIRDLVMRALGINRPQNSEPPQS